MPRCSFSSGSTARNGSGFRRRSRRCGAARLRSRDKDGMRGIILAAGRGARLNGGNGEMPKCLVTLGGETLLSRNIRILRAAGLDEIVVVIGCAAATVRRSCSDVTFVENTQFAQTNS